MSRDSNKSDSIARTKRIKLPKRDRRETYRRYRSGEPATKENSTQTTGGDREQNQRDKRSRQGRGDNRDGGGGGGGGGGDGERIERNGVEGGGNNKESKEGFHSFRDRFEKAGGQPIFEMGGGTGSGETGGSGYNRRNRDNYRDSVADGTISDAPSERTWRKAVYGDTPASTRSSRRRAPADECDSDMTSAFEDEDIGSRWKPRTSTPNPESRHENHDYEERGSRKEKRSQGSSRDSRHGFSRSTSRDSILDDKPRRRRHGSKERQLDGALNENASLTPENLSLRDSIEKVKQWKQNLPSPEPHRHPGVGAETNKDSYRSPRPENRGDSPERSGINWKQATQRQDSRSARDESPTMFSRDSSPNRRNKYRARKHPSKGNSNELENGNIRDHSLPNKDFRKSELNKADSEYYQRNEPLSPRAQGNKLGKGSGSSSDAFTRDDSPNAQNRRGGLASRQTSNDPNRRIKRENSREDLLDDRLGNQGGSSPRQSSPYNRFRRQTSRKDQSGDGLEGASDSGGFSREDSPNRHSRGGKPPLPGRSTSRQSSMEDMLDDRRGTARQVRISLLYCVCFTLFFVQIINISHSKLSIFFYDKTVIIVK